MPSSDDGGESKMKLKLYNSLTRQKEEFIPRECNKVGWYSCGPTVYDAAHMGHARSYISFDILRRVLANYFKYDVLYVMNITDIDDKIIKRARQQHLFEQYRGEERSMTATLEDCRAALGQLEGKLGKTTDPDKITMLRNTQEKVCSAILNVEASLEAGGVNLLSQDYLLEECEEVLSDWLDHQHGADVTDNSIFDALPRKWETAFHKDMEDLNVLPADRLTRVSEYIPQILSYIQRIMDNGLAYESNGSVYFDTIKFGNHPLHTYAKLVPEARGDISALQEGEGELTEGKEKRNPVDFALWKASKKGEPSWDSPWGKGRPGWHIECSAMASDQLGDQLDIHTGGIDLKFPHHDNELAQSEAYFDNDNWVRYFLHSGHLKIAGCKMSKSLKNFVTIQEALSSYSSDQLRVMFLLHSWKDTLDYSPNTMEGARKYMKDVSEFNLTVEDLARRGQGVVQEEAGAEYTLREKLLSTQQQVHEALCDNVDTKASLGHLKMLISAANIYIRDRETSKESPHTALLLDIRDYIKHILQIFGVQGAGWEVNGNSTTTNLEEAVMPYFHVLAQFEQTIRDIGDHLTVQSPEISRSILQICEECSHKPLKNKGITCKRIKGQSSEILLEASARNSIASAAKLEEAILPFLTILVDFRESMRKLAKQLISQGDSDGKQAASKILQASDRLRDDILPELGVRLEDKEGHSAAIKLVGREILMKERQERLKREEEERERKEKKRLEQERLQAEKEAKKKIPPEQYFLGDLRFSKFDEKGLPTHDAEGKELGKGQLKKLLKEYEKQKANYESYRAQNS